MSARHARADDDAPAAPTSVLHLVDDDLLDDDLATADPGDVDVTGGLRTVDPRGTDFSPEVRAVLDAVAALHAAVISWAASTAPTGARHTAPANGRHRR